MHWKPLEAREGVWRVRIKSHRERLKISGFIFFYKLFCVGIKWCVLGSMRVSHFNFCFVSCKLYLELFFILFCFIGRGVGNRRGFKAIIFNHIACMSSWTLLIPVIFLDFLKTKYCLNACLLYLERKYIKCLVSTDIWRTGEDLQLC